MIFPMGMAAAQHAGQVGRLVDNYGGPMGLAGKVIGLGADEIDAGVPGWAWFGVGVMLGGATAYMLRHKIERIAGHQ